MDCEKNETPIVCVALAIRDLPDYATLASESVPPKVLEQLATQGYHFPMLPAPFSQEELHAVVFGQPCA